MVFIFSLMMCLMSPLGERSNGISEPFTTFMRPFVVLAELLGRLQRLGIEVDLLGLGVGLGAFARIDDAHLVFLADRGLLTKSIYSAASRCASFGGRSGSSAA